jgi:hypothetical protein
MKNERDISGIPRLQLQRKQRMVKILDNKIVRHAVTLQCWRRAKLARRGKTPSEARKRDQKASRYYCLISVVIRIDASSFVTGPA